MLMTKQKIGRNDPCPCGSGKKYKKCHGSSLNSLSAPQTRTPGARQFSIPELPKDTVPQEILLKMTGRIQEHDRQEQERARRYGLVRPEIAADFNGYKFVAIGGTLLYMPADRCRFLTDVLLAYVPTLFGKEWFDQEIANTPEQRHPVMQWRIDGINYMNAQPRLPDGSYGAIPTGPLLAYITFAYDLYVVAHNARLDSMLVDRLKQKDQFQGARHELFAEATCLRAGFKIEHENERDRSRRHAEFTATHLASGQTISVEAKSKHRPGVLGQSGIREPNNDMNLRFGYLLNDAVAKNPLHPLVVFMDMNMPFETADRLLSRRPPHPFILKTLNRMRKEHGGKDPISLLMMTNHPGHYVAGHELPPHAHILGQISQMPLKPARLEALLAIVQATQLYGNVPQELPKG
jgi:SEC-C motif-containing protein